MEKSELAGNAVTFLHEEDYLEQYKHPKIDAETTIDPGLRKPSDIGKGWHFCIDPYDTGLRQKWFKYKKNPNQPQDYDPFEGSDYSIPMVWNLTKPEWFYYEGSAWYSKTLKDPRNNFDKEKCDRLILEIGGASYSCRIFIDGVFVGVHLGASTPCSFDITEYIRFSEVSLMICVNNSRTRENIPATHTDWFNYGGIHRNIFLYQVPNHFIQRTIVRLTKDQNFIEVIVKMNKKNKLPIKAYIVISKLHTNKEFKIENGEGSVIIEKVPQLWEPSNPILYKVDIKAGNDFWQDNIGFRVITAKGQQVFLNGRPRRLDGISVHEDDLMNGRITSEEDIRQRFKHARELGAIFIRLAHYPHSPMVARIADEEGLLIWSEIPVYWTLDYENPNTVKDANNQLKELIRRDINRASIIFWSLANETADTDARINFLSILANTARSEDPTRLLTAACLINQETLQISDRLVEHIDVIGVNEYFGWYDPEIQDLELFLKHYKLNKPLLISETGADAVAGHHGNIETLMTEEWQANFFENQIKILKKYYGASGPLIGITPWILYDFRSPRRQREYQNGWNRKGLIAEDKTTKKVAFQVMADFYRGIHPE